MRTTTNKAGGGCYAFDSRFRTVMRNRNNAVALGERRRAPSIRDLDYLVLRRRVAIIAKWTSELPRTPLFVIDLGGRIQPYRSFFPQAEAYLALDLLLEGLVDVVGDAGAIPVKDEVCDVVLCTQVMSYVAEPRRTVSEIYRILVPGGTLILSAPAFFPQHHDERWRFTPDGLKRLLRDFAEVEVVPECFSAAGLARSLNCLLHSGIDSYRANRIAGMTSIPAINAIGSLLDRLPPHDERCTANYCARAVKPS